MGGRRQKGQCPSSVAAKPITGCPASAETAHMNSKGPQGTYPEVVSKDRSCPEWPCRGNTLMTDYCNHHFITIRGTTRFPGALGESSFHNSPEPWGYWMQEGPEELGVFKNEINNGLHGWTI